MATPKDIQLATKLEKVMEQIEFIKAELQPLQEREEELRKELTAYLLQVGREFTRTSSGLGFGIVKGRVTYSVKKGMEDTALAWAVAEYPAVLTIAAAKLNAVVRPMLEVPEFIVRKEGEPHLSVRTTEEND
jgi:hypothetical protein